MKGSHVFSAIIAIHHVHASTNLRHGSHDKLSARTTPLAMNSADRFAQGPYTNRGMLQPVVRQTVNQDHSNVRPIFHGDSDEEIHSRNLLEQCDFCGSQGSCGRTIPLGSFFSVTVEDSEINSSWIVSCLHPNRNAPDCYYSPDGDADILSIPNEADFQETIFSCPNECCTWAYPRSKWAALPVTDTAACDGETNCREIAQICHLRDKSTKTFSCPVGTMMYVEGGMGSAKLTVEAGAQVVSASKLCQEIPNGIQCPYSRFALAMAAFISADDCNCITCDQRGIVQEGTCSTPLPSYLPSEGQCLTTFEDICWENSTSTINDTAVYFSLTARGDSNMTDNEQWPFVRNEGPTMNVTETYNEAMDDNMTGITYETISDTLAGSMDNSTSTSTLSDLAQAERNEMLAQANNANAALEALETSIEGGTLTNLEKLELLQTMEGALLALQTALDTAIEYQPKNPSYCLGIIAAIQSHIPMFRCGITSACISGADMLQLLAVDKALVVEIIYSQLLE